MKKEKKELCFALEQFLSLSTFDVWAWILSVGACLHIVGYLAASPVSVHQMLVALLPHLWQPKMAPYMARRPLGVQPSGYKPLP